MRIEIGRAVEHLQNNGWLIACLGNTWMVRKPGSTQTEMDDEQLLCLAEICRFERSTAIQRRG